LPLRGGDLGRSDLLGRRHDVPRWQGLSTVLAESLLNGLTLVPILLLAIALFPLKEDLTQNLLIFCAAIVLLLSCVVFVARRYRYAWLEGFKVFREKRRLAFACIFFSLAWLAYFAALKSMMVAMQIEVSAWAAPLLAMFLAVSMVIPAPPGRMGVFEGTVLLALALFGVPKEQALSFAIILHGAQTLPALAYGSLAAWTLPRLSPEPQKIVA